MLYQRFIIFVLLVFFLGVDFANCQKQNLIVKFRKETPSAVLRNFINNSPATGDNSVSRICRNLEMSDSKLMFGSYSNDFTKSKLYFDIGLDRIFILKIERVKTENALKLLSDNEYVDYIEADLKMKLENNEKINSFINDPFFSFQYYLNLIGIPDVWSITFCDTSVIIGVIDSGLDFLHPDLQNSYYINYGETGNGRESNGIDDDNNGFTDDWRGWNFIDNSNNPEDDNKFSHGTSVTGIISASINNGIGISPVAPKSRVLVLRCFDSDGFGKESDVASAILYGISAGVKVFNFSFGDYVYSNLLKDIIRFAYLNDIFISCSAGNDASYRLHYPSAFDEVVSVGASDQNDSKSSFSSFGVTVDIFAPGSQILSATRRGKGNPLFNNDYDYMNGTSFSAPIISGAAAMLLTRNKNLKPEEIKGIIVSSTTYMQGQVNWNYYNASGRLNAINSFNNFNLPSITKIHFPYQEYTFEKDTLPVSVSAASPLFLSFSLFYGTGIYPQVMIPIVTGVTSQVLNDTIAKWNTSGIKDTSYTLNLVMNTRTGRNIQNNLVVFKDRSKPVILNYSFRDLIYKNSYSELIDFTTDKNTIGKIFYKRLNVSEPYRFIFADGEENNTGVIAKYHSGMLKSSDLIKNTDYEFYIEAESLNGKIVTLADSNFHFRTGSEIDNYGFLRKNYNLPSSQVCSAVSDIFGNNLDNLFINEISSNYKINLYQYLNGNFLKVSDNNWMDFIIARDVADISTDGKYELLCSRSRNGYLYQATEINRLPVSLIWSDTADNNFWSSCFADTDGDSLKEIIGFGKNGLRILENSGNNNYSEIANLPYEGGITSEPNSQNVIIRDFDNDGKQEIVFSNLYQSQPSSVLKTFIIIYKNVSDNTYSKNFTYVFDEFIKAENITAGDFDGDGNTELAAGTMTTDKPLNYYKLYVLKNQNNSYHIINITEIYNYKPDKEISTKSGNIDNDNKDEILINAGTYFYILKYDNGTKEFKSVFYLNGIDSYNQVVFDFDKNGLKEFGLNSLNDSLFFYEKNSAAFTPTPLDFRAFCLDSNRVQLSFGYVSGADYYKIYRSVDSLQNYSLYAEVLINGFTDSNIMNRTNYFYKISAVDTNNVISESALTGFKNVYVHNKSKLINAFYLNDGYLKVTYSEKINPFVPSVSSFIINNDIGFPSSAVMKNSYEYLLSFNRRIPNGNYTIISKNLFDFYGSPVDTNGVNFNVLQTDTQSFYLKSLRLSAKNKLYVEFNLQVDSVSAINLNNYSFEPFFPRILSVDFDNNNKSVIYLNLEDKGYIGPSGKNYILRVKNVYSVNGIKITEGAGSSLGLTFAKENLEDVFVYPNPYKINSGKNILTFANLTPVAEIFIYDLTGRFILQIKEADKNGGADWDLKDSRGNYVSSGIYIFRVTGKDSGGNEVSDKTGKFAIIK